MIRTLLTPLLLGFSLTALAIQSGAWWVVVLVLVAVMLWACAQHPRAEPNPTVGRLRAACAAERVDPTRHFPPAPGIH